MVASVGTSLFAHALLAPTATAVPIAAIPFAALALALGLEEVGTEPRETAILGVGTLLFALALRRDFIHVPDAPLRVFGTPGLGAADSVSAPPNVWTAALVGFGLFAIVAMLRKIEDKRALTEWEWWRDTANLWLEGDRKHATRTWVTLVGVSVTGSVFLLVATRLRASWLPSTPVRVVLANTWWVMAAGPPVILFGRTILSRWVDAITTRCFGGARGGLLVVGGFGFAWLSITQGHLRLATQCSPDNALKRYAELHKEGDPIATLGLGTASSFWDGPPFAAHYARAQDALQWLLDRHAGEDATRYLLVDRKLLPEVNRLYRKQSKPLANVPVMEASAAGALLVASRLERLERSQNPLADILLTTPPAPQITLHAELDDKLELIGLDLTDEQGHATASVVAGRPYRLTTYYRVLSAPTGAWKAFVHVDGQGRRHNADHDLWRGEYSWATWANGDVLAEPTELVLPPSFSPGTYHIYVGLFSGETRMRVTKGSHEPDGRIEAAVIRVL